MIPLQQAVEIISEELALVGQGHVLGTLNLTGITERETEAILRSIQDGRVVGSIGTLEALKAILGGYMS